MVFFGGVVDFVDDGLVVIVLCEVNEEIGIDLFRLYLLVIMEWMFIVLLWFYVVLVLVYLLDFGLVVVVNEVEMVIVVWVLVCVFINLVNWFMVYCCLYICCWVGLVFLLN